MRLAFCFLSNNTDKFFLMDSYFSTNMTNLLFMGIDSYTKNILFTPPAHYTSRVGTWNVQYKIYHFRKAFDMFSMRQDSFAMAGNSELIYIGDDDMKFNEESSNTIAQCCIYMKDNPDCGAIYLGGNFGGEGDYRDCEIYIANKGHLGTNRGIIVRNRKDQILDNRLYGLGANFDAAVGFTCLLDGYYIARRLHVPIEHEARHRLSEDNPNINYDLKYLRKFGIMSKVNKHIGEWKDHAIWPKNIFKYYQQSAMKKGFIMRYDEDGGIEGELHN